MPWPRVLNAGCAAALAEPLQLTRCCAMHIANHMSLFDNALCEGSSQSLVLLYWLCGWQGWDLGNGREHDLSVPRFRKFPVQEVVIYNLKCTVTECASLSMTFKYTMCSLWCCLLIGIIGSLLISYLVSIIALFPS